MTMFLHALLKRKVFADILMMAFLVGGVISAASIRQELMPQQNERFVQVDR